MVNKIQDMVYLDKNYNLIKEKVIIQSKKSKYLVYIMFNMTIRDADVNKIFCTKIFCIWYYKTNLSKIMAHDVQVSVVASWSLDFFHHVNGVAIHVIQDVYNNAFFFCKYHLIRGWKYKLYNSGIYMSYLFLLRVK